MTRRILATDHVGRYMVLLVEDYAPGRFKVLEQVLVTMNRGEALQAINGQTQRVSLAKQRA